jgi:superoxide dismutase, Fe-Mn family
MYKQYELPYSYDALEPHIDALTMETHYSRHHAAYTKKLNDAAVKAGTDKEIAALLSSLDEVADPALRQAIRNNGGGFYNHNLYFSTIGPNGGGEPTGAFAKLLQQEFGSFSAFQDKLSGLAMGQFGSGWAWLSAGRDGHLLLSSSPNQDNPLMEGTGCTPILGIDVWEHAYYLKYQNRRADYVKAFFYVTLWDAVAERYEQIKRGQ